MVLSHTSANHRLAALAKRLKLATALPPDQPPPELLAARGSDFDKAYIALAIKAHQDMIALFDSEAKSGQNPRLKHFARAILAELHHHLHEAETIGHKLGV